MIYYHTEGAERKLMNVLILLSAHNN